MTVFVDSPAVFALVDENDDNHSLAARRLLHLISEDAYHEDVLPQLITAGVTERADRRKLSLVDCVSFEVMRDAGIQTSFAFDRHFVEEGFDCNIPASRSH